MKGINADPVATAESLIGSPMHQAYAAKAPGGADSWVDAVKEIATLVGVDYDLSAEIPSIAAPTLVIVGDWDAVRISAATKLFEMLGGGTQDANWDRSGMGQNHFAVIPNATHYETNTLTAVGETAIAFLDGYPQPAAQ
jgi:pimeloyl-ACP methyl ester carboxylesterase